MVSRIANWYRFLRARRAFLRVLIEEHLESNCQKYPSLIARYRGTSLYMNLIHEINQDRLSKRTNLSGTPTNSMNRRSTCILTAEIHHDSPTLNRGSSGPLDPVPLRKRGFSENTALVQPHGLTPSFSSP